MLFELLKASLLKTAFKPCAIKIQCINNAIFLEKMAFAEFSEIEFLTIGQKFLRD